MSRKMTGGQRRLVLTAWTQIALFLHTISVAQEARTLSIEEAIAAGLENSRALKISATKVDAANAQASEATASLLPSVKLAASYQRLSDVDPFQVKLPNQPAPFVIAPTVLNNYSARVSLQQPLFTGFKLESNARAADYLAKASEFDNTNDKSNIALAITAAYWTLYQTMQTRSFLDENVARLQTVENDTRNLLKTGMVTRNDLLKVQLQLNSAKLSQIDAANDAQIAMMNLNNVIGLPLETELGLTSAPFPPMEPEGKPRKQGEAPVGAETYLTQAFQHRADMLAMQSRVEAARSSVRAAQGNWWPQLYLTGGYTYARPNLRYQPTRDEFKGTWDVGVQLQFDIWNWGATAHRTGQAEALLTQTELVYEQVKENVSLDVRRQWLALERAKEKVAVAVLAIEQAEENQRSTNDKYKQGLATSTEQLDASVALLQAKTSYSASLVEYEIARAKWKNAIGMN